MPVAPKLRNDLIPMVAVDQDGKPWLVLDVSGDEIGNAPATRAFAVDYSGKCGSPALLVVVDAFAGASDRRKSVQFSLGHNREYAYKPAGENGFTLTAGGGKGPVVARGTLATPAELTAGTEYNAPNLLHAGGRDFYFCVITLSPDGKHAEAKVSGEGRGATVTVGGRTVRFDGERVVLGD